MENENKVLSDEELKDVSGGTEQNVNPTIYYCEGHITEQSCRGTNLCQWHPGRHEDHVTGTVVEGWCVPKGSFTVNR